MSPCRRWPLQLLFGAVMTISTSFAVGYQSMYLTGFPSTDYATHTFYPCISWTLVPSALRWATPAIAVFLFAMMFIVYQVVNKALSKLISA